MRIVVDGTRLCNELTGIGRYTQSLLAALASQRNDWEFIVLSPYVPRERIDLPNVLYDLATSKAKSTRIRGWHAWWFDAVLPRVVDSFMPCVFWAADGLAPFSMRRALVALTIYDYTPQLYPETMAFVPRHYRNLNQLFWLRRARWLLPISNSVANETRQLHGIEPGPVIYPGVDDIFRHTARDSKAHATEYFITVGTIEPRKNFKNLLLCVRRLVDEGIWPSGLKLRIVGGKGWRDTEILREIQSLEEKGIAERLGYVPREDLPRLLAGARALLMPSIYEGFGIPVAEALACGCPVICSDIAPFREIASAQNAVFHGVDLDSMLATYRQLFSTTDLLPNNVAARSIGNFDWAVSANAFATVVST